MSFVMSRERVAFMPLVGIDEAVRIPYPRTKRVAVGDALAGMPRRNRGTAPVRRVAIADRSVCDPYLI